MLLNHVRETRRKRTEKGPSALSRYLADPVKESGLVVAAYLQRTGGGSAPIKRVLLFCREVMALRTAGAELLPDWEPLEDGSEISVRADSEYPLSTAVVKLNWELRRYQTPLQLAVPTRTHPELRFSSTGFRTEEEEIANRLVRLTVAGDLDYLRECANCEGWFFALRSDQIQCDSKCTIQKYRSGRDFQKRQRLDQKVRYWTQRVRGLKVDISAIVDREERQKLRAALDRAIAKLAIAKKDFAALPETGARTERETNATRKS